MIARMLQNTLLPANWFDAGTHITDGTLALLLNASNQRVEASTLGTLRLPNGLPDGSTVRTLQPRATWTLSSDTTLDEVDGEVIANGDRRWIREAGTDAAYQLTEHWYASTGADWHASGTDEDHPTTFEEIVRRLGGTISVAVTIHILNDHDRAIYFHLAAPSYPVSLTISGAGYAVPLATGTVSAFTPTTAGTLGVAGNRGHLTANITLTSHVGRMARVTSGDQTGAQFPILGTSNLGGVEIGVPQLTPYFGDPVDIDVGSSFVVERLPKFGTNLKVSGGVEIGVDNLEIGSDESHSTTFNVRSVQLSSCIAWELDIRGGEESQILNCYLPGAARFVSATAIFFLGACASTGLVEVREGGRVEFCYFISRREIIIYPQGKASITNGAWLAVFDSAASLSVGRDGIFYADASTVALWSENITPVIARVVVNGTLYVKGTAMPAINGSGTEYNVGGTTRSSAQIVSGTGYASTTGARVVLV